MNKLKLALLLGCFFGAVSAAHAWPDSSLIRGENGWFYSHVAASGSVITGAGELGAIYLSSGPGSAQEYAVVYDTSATTSVLSNVAANASQRMTPALIFNSSVTVNTAVVGTSLGFDRAWFVVDGSGNGVRFQNGLYYLPTNPAAGESLRAIVKWRR